MADEIDRAQAHDEFFRELALRNRSEVERRASNDTFPTNDVRRNCIDCGGPIPEARRRAAPGCTRCVDCQTGFEQIRTRWRAL